MTAVTYQDKTKTGRTKWRPKEWRAEYQRIVAYSVLGKSNIWIADTLGFTKEHVSTILNMPEGRELREQLKIKLAKKIEESVPDVLADISNKAVERVKEILNNDELAKKSPFAVAGLAMDVLKGQGHLRGGGNGAPTPNGPVNFNQTNVILAPAQTSSIMDGLRMIKEVRQIHAPVQDSYVPKLQEKEEAKVKNG